MEPDWCWVDPYDRTLHVARVRGTRGIEAVTSLDGIAALHPHQWKAVCWVHFMVTKQLDAVLP